MATIQPPINSQQVLGSGGLFTTPWYRYFSSLNTAANGYTVLQNEINALQAQVDAIPAGFRLQSQMSIAQAGAASPGSVITLSLVNDAVSPSNYAFYGTGPTGDKGWNALSDAFNSTATITKTVGTNGSVSFNADLFYIMATR